eukprot:scaffold748_cov251-Pinguiococcus_pyrenoidosus.AAC.20
MYCQGALDGRVALGVLLANLRGRRRVLFVLLRRRGGAVKHGWKRIHQQVRALLEELHQQLGCSLIALEPPLFLRDDGPGVHLRHGEQHGDARHFVTRLQRPLHGTRSSPQRQQGRMHIQRAELGSPQEPLRQVLPIRSVSGVRHSTPSWSASSFTGDLNTFLPRPFLAGGLLTAATISYTPLLSECERSHRIFRDLAATSGVPKNTTRLAEGALRETKATSQGYRHTSANPSWRGEDLRRPRIGPRKSIAGEDGPQENLRGPPLCAATVLRCVAEREDQWAASACACQDLKSLAERRHGDGPSDHGADAAVPDGGGAAQGALQGQVECRGGRSVPPPLHHSERGEEYAGGCGDQLGGDVAVEAGEGGDAQLADAAVQ